MFEFFFGKLISTYNNVIIINCKKKKVILLQIFYCNTHILIAHIGYETRERVYNNSYKVIKVNVPSFLG